MSPRLLQSAREDAHGRWSLVYCCHGGAPWALGHCGLQGTSPLPASTDPLPVSPAGKGSRPGSWQEVGNALGGLMLSGTRLWLRKGPDTGTVGSSARPQSPRLGEGVRVGNCQEVKLV